MIDIKSVQKLALSFDETEEKPHFEKTSFRVKNKIFATVDAAKKQACIKLSEIDQSVFSAYNPAIIYPVPNKWGKQGWTMVELTKVPKAMFKDALTTAYCAVAPKKLAEKYKSV
jgi:predicted DNA-binding protein (MmcQ/YjbR family)